MIMLSTRRPTLPWCQAVISLIMSVWVGESVFAEFAVGVTQYWQSVLETN